MSLALAFSLAACSSSSGPLAPRFETSADIAPMALPAVTGARSVSARSYLLPRGGENNEIVEVPDAAIEACKAREDVLGRIPLDLGVVQVGPDTLAFAGRELFPLEERRVPERRMRGMLITTLHDRLIEKAESATWVAASGCAPWRKVDEGPAFAGDLLLAVDQGVPFVTAAQVMYTAGQAGFTRLAFLVEGPIVGPLDGVQPIVHDAERVEDSAPPLNLAVSIDAQGLLVSGYDAAVADGVRLACGDGACDAADDFDLAALRTLLSQVKDGWPDEDQVILTPGLGVSFAALARIQDACAGTHSRALFPNAVVAMPAHDDWSPVRPLELPARGRTILPDDVLTVLPSFLPELRAEVAE